MWNFFRIFAHRIKKKPIQQEEYDKMVEGLAYTDFSKPSPVLTGEDAEKFVKNMEEAEKKAKERANRPKTKVEIESELSIMKMMYEYEERELGSLKNKIYKLEKELNDKTEKE